MKGRNLFLAGLLAVTAFASSSAIAQKMIDALEGMAFDNKAIDKVKAEHLIVEADALIASVH